MQALRSALVSSLRSPIRQSKLSLVGKALAILRKFGSNAHVYTPGSTQVSYGVELVTTQFTSLAGYANQTGCTVAIVGDEVEVTATQTGVCFVDTPAVTTSVGSPYRFYVLARYSGAAGGVVYLGAAMASVPYSSSTTSATSVPLTLTPTSDNALVRLRLRIDASAIGQKAYFKLGSVRQQITTSSVTAGLLTSNYTTNDGSTGLSAIDGTAGLVLDAAGATVQYNPATVPTGSYDGTGASTVVRTGASLTFTSAPSGDGIRLTPIYGASDTFSYVKFTASGSGSLIVFAGGSPVTFTLTGTPTQYQCGTSGNSSAWLIFRSNSAGMSASITINEISGSSGIHASQSTAANRPSVRRGLLNVLKQSNTFTDANWVKTNITPTAGVADPFGGTAATTLTATGVGEIYQTAADAGKPYTSGIYIRRRTGSGTVSIRNAANTAWIPLSLTSAWQLLVNDGGTTTANWYLDLQISTSGDAVDVYGAIVSPGTLTASQILSEGGIPLTLAAAASNAGAGRCSWGVDTDDSLSLGSVPFQFTDDYFVCIGAACNNKASYPGVLDATGGTARMYLYFDASGVVVSNYKTDAAVDTYVQGPAFVDGAAGVISMYKQSGQVCTGWNGVDGTPAAAPAGTYTITTAKFSNLLNGLVAPAVLIKGQVSAADRLTLKRWVASLTPAGPVF